MVPNTRLRGRSVSGHGRVGAAPVARTVAGRQSVDMIDAIHQAGVDPVLGPSAGVRACHTQRLEPQ